MDFLHRRRLSLLATTAALGVVASLAPAAQGSETVRPADFTRATQSPAERPTSTVIPGSYIVVLKKSATRSAGVGVRALASVGAGEVFATYRHSINGFAARLNDRALRQLRAHPDVAFIEPNRRVSLSATQPTPPWGLDRIDQRNRPLTESYDYSATGVGVTAYIIDTGIRANHEDFGGRVISGYSTIDDNRGTSDCVGHGTHVAGTVGGATYGVAKAVTLVPVRVLGCRGRGTTAGIVAGMDWTISHHEAGVPAVANASLGGARSKALDRAAGRIVADGITFVASAGNANTDACDFSPGRAPAALTVGSTTRGDARSSFSNTGSCVDIFAPGSEIVSASRHSSSAKTTLSGTSMAAPHVAGAAALILEGSPAATPQEVSSTILGQAVTGKVINRGKGSPNRLLRVSAGVEPEPLPVGIVKNAGFEAGPTGWSATTPALFDSEFLPARTGGWKAWLGGFGKKRSDSLSQTFRVPKGKVSLEFWMMIRSRHDRSARSQDRLTVSVQAGRSTKQLAVYSHRQKGFSYERKTFNLSKYAGRRVTLRFASQEDAARVTSFYIDDVSVTKR